MAATLQLSCPACSKVIGRNNQSYFALNELWHIDCFRCCICNTNLTENYFSKELKLYCREHFLAKFIQSCHRCNTKITGPVMVAGDVSYHPECFMCSKCKKYIGDGDEYTLEDRYTLFCDECYRRKLKTKLKDLQNFFHKKQHFIQHVQIKPGQFTERPFHLNIEKRKTTEKKLSDEVLKKTFHTHSELVPKRRQSCISIRSVTSVDSPVKAGDKVIEVNGVAVTDENIQEVTQILQREPSQPLYITIERTTKERPTQEYKSDAAVKDSDIQKPSDPHRRLSDQTQLQTDRKISNEQQKLSNKERKISDEQLLRTERQISNERKTPIDRRRSEEQQKGSFVGLDDSPQERRKERNIQFFNFSVFKRTTSDISGMKRRQEKHKLAKKAEKEKDKLEVPPAPFLPRTLPNRSALKRQEPKPQIRRARSLTEIDGEGETHNKENAKCYAQLHRAQSFKSENATSSQVFRPSDLARGDLIGQGFFGEVIKVTDSRTGEVMVMKQLKDYDQEAQETFLNEVQLLKSLKHPNVLRFIGVMYKNKALNIITEYVSGGTLRKLIKNPYKEMSWKQRVKFAKDIASGMTYLHSMGIIHRDLTSKNCLLRNDEDGKSVVVADFGLAKVILEEDSRSPLPPPSPPIHSPHHRPLSPVGPNRPPHPKKRLTVVGSPFWMAPEMMSGKEYDERVDIFSFGIVVCEIIGRVKADPDYLPRTSEFGLDDEAFKEKFCAECPVLFFQVAVGCCQLNPDDRPPFSTLEKWLEAILASLELKINLPENIDFRVMPRPLLYQIDESHS